jgi:hypothetical protein
MPLMLASPAFAPGGQIPSEYTCDGADISPPLSWSGVPPGAKSLILVVEDPDAAMGAIGRPPDFARRATISATRITVARARPLGMGPTITGFACSRSAGRRLS